MDGHPATEHSQAALKRIVALLFALADLAELAGGRSRAVRALVLLILRPAAAAAQRLVMDACGDASAAPIPRLQDGGSSTDAIRLALSFRALAAALASLPEWAFECDDLQAADKWLRPVAGWIGRAGETLSNLAISARPEVRTGALERDAA